MALAFAIPRPSQAAEEALTQTVSQLAKPYLAQLPADRDALRPFFQTLLPQVFQQHLETEVAKLPAYHNLPESVAEYAQHTLQAFVASATDKQAADHPALLERMLDASPRQGLQYGIRHTVQAANTFVQLADNQAPAFKASSVALYRLHPHINELSEAAQSSVSELLNDLVHLPDLGHLPPKTAVAPAVHYHDGVPCTHHHPPSAQAALQPEPTPSTASWLGRLGEFKLVSTQWQDWAKIGAAVAGVNFLQQGSGLAALPGWATAMGMVTMLHPAMNGLARHKWAALPIIAPLVGANVAATNAATAALHQQLDHHTDWSETTKQRVTTGARVTLGLTGALVSIPAYAWGFGKWGQTGLAKQVFGPLVADEARQAVQVAQKGLKPLLSQLVVNNPALTCVRGCCAGSLLCIQEVVELLVGLLFPSRSTNSTPPDTPPVIQEKGALLYGTSG